MINKIVPIGYLNVVIFLHIINEEQDHKLSYLEDRIRVGQSINMRQIASWCDAQEISFRSHFFFLKSMPFTANLWNFANYMIFRSIYKSAF